MFLFQISSYDDAVLDTETQELLRQRLELHSRRVMPGMWNLTDSINTYTAREPEWEKRKVKQRLYGIVLMGLGVFVLVPGLMEPRRLVLIWAGGFAILAGVLKFGSVRGKKAPKITAACQKEANLLLEERRAIDWVSNPVKIRFDEDGMVICTNETEKLISYDKIKSAFETEHLWLLVYQEEKALLLQKKDLILGQTSEFFSYMLQKIAAKRHETKKNPCSPMD